MKYRVAVVADIHANIYALNVFLEYLHQNNIDKVLNLGDFVQIGPDPNEVTDIVLNDKRFMNILGNNEISLFVINENNTNTEIAHRVWTKKQIASYMEQIKILNENFVTVIDGLRVLMIHSRKDNISGKPLIYKENMESFENDYKEFEADIILFGHTHEKLFIEHHSKIYINPGSLGCSFNKSADFAILEFEDSKLIKCTFESLEYDKNLVINDYLKKDVPDKEFILKNFYGYEI